MTRLLYSISLYAQLGLILVSCPAAMVIEWIDDVVFGPGGLADCLLG
jgi:hypothetical protein